MEKLINDYDYDGLYSKIGYEFKNHNLLKEAFTHKGYNHKVHYERLEFLGDRVVNLVIAELLFTRFKKEPEGDLAKRHAALVRREAMSKIALELDLDSYIMLNEYEESERSNPSLLCDICEAVMGALYFDAGYEKVREIIVKYWQKMIEEYKTPPIDAKTKLQEWTQARKMATPVYEVVGSEGVEHAPVFIVRAMITGIEAKIAKGNSKREAEQKAAKAILDGLGEK